jgi:hypothetical protein
MQYTSSNEHANYPGDRRFWGQNPEPGAAISYFLKETPDDIRLIIRDDGGRIVREISSDNLKNFRSVGLNKFYWDMRHQPIETAAGRQGGGFGGGMGGGSSSPLVLPGTYRVTLLLSGRETGSRLLQIQGDPQIVISNADRKIHHDTILMLYDLQRPMNDASAASSTAGEQLRAIQDLLKTAASPPPSLTEATAALAKRFGGLNQQFSAAAPAGGRGAGGGAAQGMRGQINALRSQLMAFTTPLTTAQIQAARDSRAGLAKAIADLNDALTASLPALIKNLSGNKIQVPPMKPIPPVRLEGTGIQK